MNYSTSSLSQTQSKWKQHDFSRLGKIMLRSLYFVSHSMQCCQVLELKIHSMFSLVKLHLNCDANMVFFNIMYQVQTGQFFCFKYGTPGNPTCDLNLNMKDHFHSLLPT
jgi:hypothetical protein